MRGKPRPRMLRPGRGLAVAASLLVFPSLSGCRGDPSAQAQDFLLDVAISPTPPGVGPARLIITLRDTLGTSLDGAEVLVEGNMSHAGMTPVIDTARALGEGVYRVPDFTFTMAGDWVLTITATLPDGRRAVLRKRTDVVNAPPGLPGRSSEPIEGRENESHGRGAGAPAPGT